MYLRDVYTLQNDFLSKKFLSLTVKVGKNKNKIDNTRSIMNLLAELESYLERRLKRK